jgi:hypothetical protein
LLTKMAQSYKDRHIAMWNGIENSKLKTHACQLKVCKFTKNTKWKKIVFSTEGLVKIKTPYLKEWNWTYITHKNLLYWQ